MQTAQRKPNRAERRRSIGKGKRVGLSNRQAEALKRRLRGNTDDGRKLAAYDRDGLPRFFAPSDPWVHELVPVITEMVGNREVRTYQHCPDRMPPGMIRCEACGHYSPPQMIGSSGACYDCRLARLSPAVLAALPGSTSSVSLAKIRASRARAQESVPGGM